MVKRCVVQFCSNSNETGYTMHKFPKDANLRRQWLRFVQLKRADFVEPSPHSVICHIHFSPECYEKNHLEQMGFKAQKKLLSGAVPTIQSPEATKSSKRRMQTEDSEGPEVADNTERRPKKSRALQKLEVNRVSYTSVFCVYLKNLICCT